LTELLLSKGWVRVLRACTVPLWADRLGRFIVHGIVRRSSTFNTGRIWHLKKDPQYKQRMFLHYGDLTDSTSIVKILSETKVCDNA
jgi:hypothetical protein